jgi:hypothetical protein
MKKLFVLASLLLGGQLAAEETLLTCLSNDDSEEIESVTIRFDESENVFELRGKAMWSVKRDRDGAAKVTDLEFSEDLITVKFKRRSALWLSLGAAAASGGRVGVLDRVTGIWTLGGNTFNCTVADAGNRVF